MTNHDNWLENQAENEYSECIPTITDTDTDMDEEGNIVLEHTWSCKGCAIESCEYWRDHND